MRRSKTLPDGTVPPFGNWQVKTVTPTAHPLVKLADTLLPGDYAQQLMLREQALIRIDALRTTLVSKSTQADYRLLLFVDQFEELFTHCKDKRARDAFIMNLLAAANESCKILITLRADFYIQCLRYEGLRQVLKTAQEPIGAMTSQELAAAILEPAAKGNWKFQAGLVEEMLEDVGREPGALPFLSHALLETWQRRRGRILTLSGYRQAGKVQGAIAQTAEATYAALTVREQSIAQRIFLRLTELGEGTQDTRRRVSQTELGNDTDVHTVIQRLADARLITTTKDGVDVAHEALIRAWPTLRRWLDDNREDLRLHRQLTEATQVWVQMDRDNSVLFRGAKLKQVQAWAAENDALLNQMEKEFLAASVALLKAQEKATRQRTQRIIVGLSVALVIISTLAIAALTQWRATLALQEKILAQELATRAESFINVDNELALLLALEAARLDSSEERIDSTLRRVSTLPTTANVLLVHPGLRTFAFSHDGEMLVTAGDDTIARVWSWPAGEQLTVLEGHSGWIMNVDFDATDERVLTASTDGTARLWDASSGRLIAVLQDPNYPCPKEDWDAEYGKPGLVQMDDGLSPAGQMEAPFSGMLPQAKW